MMPGHQKNSSSPHPQFSQGDDDIRLGTLRLTRNPDNSFSPANQELVLTDSLSPDFPKPNVDRWSLIRNLVHNNTVISSQIKSILTEKLSSKECDPHNIDRITKILCRAINELSLNGEASKGKSLAYSGIPQKNDLIFRDINETSSLQKFDLPFNCWIERSKDETYIDVSIFTTDYIQSGSYKNIFNAHKFRVFSQKKFLYRPVEYHPITIQYPKMYISLEDNKFVKKTIKNCIKMHYEIFEKFGDRAKKLFTEPPTYRLPDYNGKEITKFEFTQRKYLGDLFQAIEATPPIVSPSTRKNLHIPHAQQLKFIKKKAYTAQELHDKGYVHCDLKAENVLVDDENGVLDVKLNDFDLVQPLGIKLDKSNHENNYWDWCRYNGIILPSTDCYGLAITIGNIFIPDFLACIDDKLPLTNSNLKYLKNRKFDVTTLENNLILHFGNLANQCPRNSTIKRPGIWVSLQEILEYLSKYLASSKDNSATQLQIALCLEDLFLTIHAIKLVSTIIKQCADLYEYLKAHPLIQEDLYNPDETIRIRARTHLQTKYWSAKQIGDEIQLILDGLNQLHAS